MLLRFLRTKLAAKGRITYVTTCQTCHGADGKGGAQGGQPLTSALTLADIINTLTNGRNNMPAFGSVMPQEDLQDVATYLVNELIPANGQ